MSQAEKDWLEARKQLTLVTAEAAVMRKAIKSFLEMENPNELGLHFIDLEKALELNAGRPLLKLVEAAEKLLAALADAPDDEQEAVAEARDALRAALTEVGSQP